MHPVRGTADQSLRTAGARLQNVSDARTHICRRSRGRQCFCSSGLSGAGGLRAPSSALSRVSLSPFLSLQKPEPERSRSFATAILSVGQCVVCLSCAPISAYTCQCVCVFLRHMNTHANTGRLDVIIYANQRRQPINKCNT